MGSARGTSGEDGRWEVIRSTIVLWNVTDDDSQRVKTSHALVRWVKSQLHTWLGVRKGWRGGGS